MVVRKEEQAAYTWGFRSAAFIDDDYVYSSVLQTFFTTTPKKKEILHRFLIYICIFLQNNTYS